MAARKTRSIRMGLLIGPCTGPPTGSNIGRQSISSNDETKDAKTRAERGQPRANLGAAGDLGRPKGDICIANAERASYAEAMPYEFRVQRRVEFNETDMAGLMHFSNFFRFMETAEHAFFRSLGFSIARHDAHPRLGWPRVHAHCDYSKPVFFEDVVEVHLLVAEKRSRGLTFHFHFRKLNADPPVEVARGSITTVCVTHEPDGQMRAVPIPADVATKIEVAPVSLLHQGKAPGA